jgi:hypothetical protein
MTPGAGPIDSLETALLRVAVNPPPSLRQQLAETGGLLRAVRRVLPDDRTRLLLVIDQLEEFFTMSGDDAQHRLLDELAHAVLAPGSPLHVVATLRADHYDAPLRHPAFADLVTTGTVTIRPMTPADLERAIVKPAHSMGVDIEPALVADLVARVSERPSALPLLQFALTECFERRVSDVMPASVHDNLGGLTGAVAARADRIVEDGGPEDEAETRRIFGRLVTLGDGVEDTGRRALRSEFGNSERTAWLLDAFTNARLLTVGRDETSREPTVEVAHEALLRDWPRLAGWLAEDRADLRLLRAITTGTTAWIRTNRDDGELARSGRLESAADLSTRRPELLNNEEQAWIEASRTAADDETHRQLLAIEHDRRQNRRLRQLLTATSVLAMVAVAGGAISVAQRNRAETNEERAVAAQMEAESSREDADIERLTALSTASITSAPDVAILLALEALRRRDDIATQTALHRAIATQGSLVGVLPNPLGEAASASLSGDGLVAVVWSTSSSGRLGWFDADSGTAIAEPYISEVPISDVAVSGDGSTAAIAQADGWVRLIDSSGNEIAPDHSIDGVLEGLSLSGDGSRLLVSTQRETRILDVSTGNVVSRYPMPGGRGLFDVPVALAADGETFAIDHLDVAVAADSIPDGEEPGGFEIVDAGNGELLQFFDTDPANVTVVGWSPLGQVVVGRDDGIVEVVGRGSGEPTRFAGSSGAVAAVATASSSRRWHSEARWSRSPSLPQARRWWHCRAAAEPSSTSRVRT